MTQVFNSSFVFLRKHQVTILFSVAAILLFAGLGTSPIYILDEARNAQAAREMMEHKEWIVPTFNGELRPHKPPLHYYFMWAAYRLFGTNAFAARFFSALMGWLTIWVTWFFTKRFASTRAAFWSAVVLTVSTHFLFEFRLAVPDPYLVFFTTTGTLLFYAFVKENKTGRLIASSVAFALAALSKGPVALALPGAAIGIWLLVQKKIAVLWQWKMLMFFAITLIIATPWYIMVHYATAGQFTKEFFLKQNLGRFGEAMEGHGGFFLLVPLFVLIGLLPLSLFLFGIFKKWKTINNNPYTSLCLWVTIVFIAFFSVSGTKLPNYPMPCYPFLAVIMGCWVDSIITNKTTAKRYPFLALLILNTLLLAAAFIGLGLEPATKTFRLWALLFLFPAIISLICWKILKARGLTKTLTVLGIGYSVFNLFFLAVAYPAIYQSNPVNKTKMLLSKGEQVYAYKIYNPAYNFYLNKPVTVVNDKKAVEAILQEHPDAKIISRESELRELEGIHLKVIGRERDLFEIPVTVILARP